MKTQIQTPTKRELTVYHKDFTDAQYNFVEKYDLSKIVQIYRLNEGQMDRLYDYLIFFGFNPKLQSFYAFLAAVQFYSGEQRLENLVDKLIKVKWDGKPVDATPTTIKLLLVHQYRQVDVLRYKECNIDLLSLIKMLRIMMKEEIFV